jgi:hypothetical protein
VEQLAFGVDDVFNHSVNVVRLDSGAGSFSGYVWLVAASVATVGVGMTGLLAGNVDGWPDADVARLVLVLAVLTSGALARVCVTCGGIATADFMIRSLWRRAESAVSRQMRARGMSAAGVALGVAVVATASGLGLVADGDSRDYVVVVLAGLCLMIRSRLFGGTWNGVAFVLAGVVVLLAGLVGVLSDAPPRSQWMTPLALAASAGLLLAIVQGRRRTSSPNRALHWAESTAVTTLVCATAIATGLLGSGA